MKKIRLSPYTRARVLEMIRNAPDGYCVTPPQEPTRTLSQNAKLWAMLEDVARQVRWPVNGKEEELSPEAWKDIFTAALTQEQRLAAGLRGGVVLLGERTSCMGIRRMSELIELIYAFGAERGVVWSEPIEIPEQYQGREAA